MEVSLASSFVVVAVPLRLRRRRSEKSEIIDVSRFSAREEAYGGEEVFGRKSRTRYVNPGRLFEIIMAGRGSAARDNEHDRARGSSDLHSTDRSTDR